MIVQRIKGVVDQIVNRVPMTRRKGEEATKQALVLPMLDALGYDIWNPQEVCPEYEADFAIRKAGQKEKVDLAVLLGGQPRVYIEIKEVDTPLEGHQGQLSRYFNATSSVSLGVLTNGIEYRFFTDTGDPNVMDSRPFHTFRVDAVDQRLEILARFHKSVFSPEAIRDFATELNYTTAMADFLRGELDLRDKEPSERLVRWILSAEKMYESKVTINVVDRFRPIVKNALQLVLKEIVRRSVAAMEKEVSAPEVEKVPEEIAPAVAGAGDRRGVAGAEPAELGAPEADQESRIATTERELDCFAVVKQEFDNSELVGNLIYSRSDRKGVPVELAYKDTVCYFVVYLNRPSCWAMRLVVETRNPWIGFNVAPDVGSSLVPPEFKRLQPHPWAEFRVAFSEPADLHALRDLILASIRKTIEDRRPSTASAVS